MPKIGCSTIMHPKNAVEMPIIYSAIKAHECQGNRMIFTVMLKGRKEIKTNITQ